MNLPFPAAILRGFGQADILVLGHTLLRERPEEAGYWLSIAAMPAKTVPLTGLNG